MSFHRESYLCSKRCNIDHDGRAGLPHVTEKGKHYGQLTPKYIDVLEALLWKFHNALSGLCFPSEGESCAHHSAFSLMPRDVVSN